MDKHHTKTSGDLGVFKAMADLHEKGYVVADPLTEHASFDLIIWKDGVARTVQVKYRSKSDGKVQVRFVSHHSDSNGFHREPVDKEKIDLYCIYCPETDKCYYVDPDNFGKSVSLRIDKPKNNQTDSINFADDYLEVP